MWWMCDLKISLLLCYALSLSTLCSGYVITTPKRWTSGEESQVCVILSAPAVSDQTITFEMTSWYEGEKNLIPQMNIEVPQGTQSICQDIAMPQNEVTYADFTITGSLEGQNIYYRKHVAITYNIIQTFIQTDKYLYKPSQTVQFRILTVTGAFLQVSVEAYEAIWIENPSGIRLAQWLNVSNDNGLIHLSFELTDEPEEGEYEITVLTSYGKPYYHTFKVEEYVLPRFEVTIKPPSYVLGTTEIITLEVCARYTFGEPVNGKVSIRVENYEWYNTSLPVKKEEKISGCISFNFTADELFVNGDGSLEYYTQWNGDYQYLNEYYTRSLWVYAFVTEKGTNIELKANDLRVEIFRTALKFEDISIEKYYKPELPHIGKIKITFPDGSPAYNEPMKVCCSGTCNEISTNVEGILIFAIPPNSECNYIDVYSINYPRVAPNYPFSTIMYESRFDKSLKKYYSPSNSFLIISLPYDELACTSTKDKINFMLPVMFAVNQSESAFVTVQIVSRGQIQFSKTFNQTFEAGPLVSIPESFFIGEVNKNSTSNLIKGKFKVPISLPKTVSPLVQVLVWYARDDGEVVSAFREISVMECLLNSVDIMWSTDKAFPGSNVSVSLKAEPLSLCSLGVVDKSVDLLTPKTYLMTVKKLLDLAQSASDYQFYLQQQIDDYEYCRNQHNPSTTTDTSTYTTTTSSVDTRTSTDSTPPTDSTTSASPTDSTFSTDSTSSTSPTTSADSTDSLSTTDSTSSTDSTVSTDSMDSTSTSDSTDSTSSDSTSSTSFTSSTTSSMDPTFSTDSTDFWNSTTSLFTTTPYYPFYHYYTYYEYYTYDVDALQGFEEAGLYVLSNLTLETRPCEIYERKYYYTEYPYHHHTVVPTTSDAPFGTSTEGTTSFTTTTTTTEVPAHTTSDAPFRTSTEGTTSFPTTTTEVPIVNSASETETNDIRTYFPEAWIWSLVDVSIEGKYEKALTLPDTVTEWVGSAVCVHQSKGVGISSTASIITFKEFFVDLTLPLYVKRGEIFTVKISIFNYLKESLPITLTLESSGSQFVIVKESGDKVNSVKINACVPAEDKNVISIRIQAKEVGDVDISVAAIVQKNASENCGSGIVQQTIDSLIQPIKVNFEGFLKEETQFKYLCRNGSEQESVTWVVAAPDSIVNDSARGYVAATGDLMGPSLENLGNLIRMPYGCGEQNMLNFAPNIFIMQYLDASNQNTPEIKSKAIEFMKQGYQRELNYRHKDYSYSAFGKSDESGSTWLTAFVLRCFAQATEYITIDTKDLWLSTIWLKSKQLENGCFESVGKVFNKAMKGGVSESESPSLLTAFVLIALLEGGESVNSTTVIKALPCINANNSTENSYSLAMKAYALALAESSDTQATLIRLLNLKTSTPSSIHWELTDQYASSQGVAVETASYAVLAFLAFTKNSIDPEIDYNSTVLSIVKWINTQRNGQGGFISTQDTIIALQALAEFQKRVSSSQGPLNLTVSVAIENVVESFTIEEQNRLLQQSVEFPKVPTTITFDITGLGCVLLQSVLRYNIPEAETSEAFSLSVKTSTEPDKKCITKRIEVCVSYLLPDKKSNMAIIEIDLVSGYIAEEEDLEKIISDETSLFKLYKIEGSKVMIYVDEFSSNKICVSFRIYREEQVQNLKPGTVMVYDYYKPENKVSEIYELPLPTDCVAEGENL